VAFARQGYNDAVTQYNTARETFPSNIIAGQLRLPGSAAAVIEDDTEREAPRVSF
jgi:LemA protein